MANNPASLSSLRGELEKLQKQQELITQQMQQKEQERDQQLPNLFFSIFPEYKQADIAELRNSLTILHRDSQVARLFYNIFSEYKNASLDDISRILQALRATASANGNGVPQPSQTMTSNMSPQVATDNIPDTFDTQHVTNQSPTRKPAGQGATVTFPKAKTDDTHSGIRTDFTTNEDAFVQDTSSESDNDMANDAQQDADNHFAQLQKQHQKMSHHKDTTNDNQSESNTSSKEEHSEKQHRGFLSRLTHSDD